MTFIPCSTFPGNGVSLGSISVFSHTSGIVFAVRYPKSLCCMYIKSLFLQSHFSSFTVLNIKGKDKMLVDCMFSQLYRSLIKSQNCWLDHSNPNFIIERAVNQFELQLELIYPQDVFLCLSSFSSLYFISFRHLSMTFLQFSLSQFWISLDYSRLHRAVNFFSSCCNFWCDFARAHKFYFSSFMKYWKTNPPYLVDREISTLSLSLQVWHPVTAAIN